MSGGFDPALFSQLAELESGNFWFRSRNRLIVWAIQKYFPKTIKMLEIGCGTGFVLSGIHKTFPGMELVGSELYADGLTFAAKRIPSVKLIQMDATRIPFENEFDLVGAFDVLEHIENDRLVLAQIRRALKPQGGILLTVPQHPSLWSAFDEYSHHVRRYNRDDLSQKIEQAGFRILRSTSFVSLLLPALYFSRLMKRGPSDHYDGLAELRKTPLTNFALEKVMDFERQWVRAGASFPIGGSLLIAAEKN